MADTTISTAEAARRAGVSGDTIRRWIGIGLLHPVRRIGPGRRYRLDPAELATVISDSEDTSSPPASGAVLPVHVQADQHRGEGEPA